MAICSKWSLAAKTQSSKMRNMLIELNKPTEENIKKLSSNIKEALGDKIDARTLSQETKLEVKDSDEMTTKEEFAAQFDVEMEISAIKSLRPAFAGTQSAIISMPSSTAEKILQAGRIKIACTICRITRNTVPTRCFKCLDFGHMAAGCKSTVDRSKCCLKCGSANHKARDYKENPKCFLCVAKGYRQVGHCEAVQDLLMQTLCERAIDVAIISEPYKLIPRETRA